MQVNIYQAKAQLSALLEQAQVGEDVVVAKAGKPVAKPIPVAPALASRSGVRFGGLSAAELKPTPDFYDNTTEDELPSG